MEKIEDIAELIKKRLDGIQSAEENDRLNQWALRSPMNGAFLKRVLEGEVLWEGVLSWLELSADENDGWQMRLEKTVLLRIGSQPHKKSSLRLLYRGLPYAAALLLFFIGAGGYYLLMSDGSTNAGAPLFDLPPGANKAFLTLADGRTLVLSSDKEGVVVGKDLTYEDGTLLASADHHHTAEPLYAMLATPAGGHYQITLPDGTKVWLNAASRLKYPTRFNDSLRVVELEGEAYFNVAPAYQDPGGKSNQTTKIPFLVKTRHQIIEVLGTQFNVSAYSDESVIKTTLVEGSVLLTSDKERMELKPGEQGVSTGAKFTKKTVDVTEFVAWKDNLFLFNETELRMAMNQLSRWYDIRVVYEKEMPETYFYGEISRSKKLSEVLKILRAGGVGFRIEKGEAGENKLIVLQ